jgi:hypothetical protein
MFGIGTKLAKIVATAMLALAAGAAVVGLSASAQAGDGNWRYDSHVYRGEVYHPHPAPYRFHGPRNVRVVVRAWEPYPYRPVISHGLVAAPCQPVIGHGFDQFGRRAKVGATMCYDRFGNGYVLSGSEHIIHYF